MVSKLGYDSYVKRLNSATVAAVALIAAAWILLTLGTVAKAQVNGVPASVASTNFGGHPNSTPGVPASITSLGTNGIQPRNPFPHQPACCMNPLFPVNPNPPHNQRHHRQSGQFFPGGGAVYIPYAYPVVGESDPGDAVADQQENQPEEDYRGGPTIFDRRGPGSPARSYADAYPPPRRPQPEAEVVPMPPLPETPVPDQPQTLLIFKDGHQLEVQNYAVIGDTLYDLTPGRHHKIALDELDLTSTAKQNDDRGIDFRLPPKPEAKK